MLTPVLKISPGPKISRNNAVSPEPTPTRSPSLTTPTAESLREGNGAFTCLRLSVRNLLFIRTFYESNEKPESLNSFQTNYFLFPSFWFRLIDDFCAF